MKSAGASRPAGHSHGLTFHWPRRSQFSLTLLGFLFFSIFLHALGFYIFQIKYPLTTTISPPPVQVSILSATPENQALLKWIDSEDPAAIANPHEIIPANLRDLPYKPSFAEIRTSPKAPDAVEKPVVFPSARSPLYIINSTKPGSQNSAYKHFAQKTVLKFSGPLSQRKIGKQPPLQFASPSSATVLQAISFFVGVGTDGRVQYTFLISAYSDHFGSGDDAIDRQAEEHLHQIEFAPGSRNVTWGIVTYFWGNDAFSTATQDTP